ncbi:MULTISPECIES: phosphoglycolate phosphatase [Methylococcus]|uniref:Phosphoglycolate phosphatase n=1 Tax=Methylococcus capsulatus TaxID=414 RepID=A0ABZ2F8H5_METCP|nr:MULTISPECIES: phosphoglycolate phosphatase [Methylococcus]MDF9391172.1 phosphoglycolate phosphatase [Methylococcus capsulatus]
MIGFRPELVAFDLDGTLVDSAPDLAWAVDAMLESLGRAPVGLERARGWIGNGADMLIKRAMTGEMWPESEPEDFREGMRLFLEFHEAHLCERGGLFPGVLEGLRDLKAADYATAVITNKLARFAEPLLERLGVTEYLDFIGSGDLFERIKPDPLPLLKTAERFGVRPERCLMVGDSSNDVRAARAAGYAILCVPYGYRGEVATPEQLGADGILNSIGELPALLNRAT